MEEIIIRTIEERDNAAIANVIRTTLAEFGANHLGTVYYDEATDRLFQGFNETPRSIYFIAEKIVFGCSRGYVHSYCYFIYPSLRD